MEFQYDKDGNLTESVEHESGTSSSESESKSESGEDAGSDVQE